MMNWSEPTFERRKSPRVEIKGLTGLPARPGVARIVDISATGAQVVFHERLVPGNLYEMKLTFPDRQIRARVQVTRSIDLDGRDAQPGEGGGKGCLAGLQFQGLQADEVRYLEAYVAGQASRQD